MVTVSLHYLGVSTEAVNSNYLLLKYNVLAQNLNYIYFNYEIFDVITVYHSDINLQCATPGKSQFPWRQ
jgi:hypothetical protein